ncbi:hypothetical protein FQZ97_919760 [compost metagenome]
MPFVDSEGDRYDALAGILPSVLVASSVLKVIVLSSIDYVLKPSGWLLEQSSIESQVLSYPAIHRASGGEPAKEM